MLDEENPDQPWVIWSHEHDAWWRPNEFGYTRELLGAGVYPRGRARQIETEANRGQVRNEEALPLAEAIGRAAADANGQISTVSVLSVLSTIMRGG